jgi:RNA polymerase sigma factor (sigma-70 family)
MTPHASHRPGRRAALAGRAAAPSRAVLVLRYFEGLSDTETADALGVSAGTVRSTASRALAVLRERSTMARLAEEAT